MELQLIVSPSINSQVQWTSGMYQVVILVAEQLPMRAVLQVHENPHKHGSRRQSLKLDSFLLDSA